MEKLNIALVVGSNRRESLNRKLAQALAEMFGAGVATSWVQIDDLPLYNQDLEGDLPASVVRFKSEIAAADGILFVTPEHNRSLPTVLKNAIDWGTRPPWRDRVARKARRHHRHLAGRHRNRPGAAASAADPRRFLAPWSWAAKPT